MGISPRKNYAEKFCINLLIHEAIFYYCLRTPLDLVRLLTSYSSDINALILDYLTLAGYPNAAKKFSAEANLPPQQDDLTIERRQQIQSAIHRGDIAEAISDLNEMDPEVRDFMVDEQHCTQLAMIRNRVLTCTTLITAFGPGDEKQPLSYEHTLSLPYYCCRHGVGPSLTWQQILDADNALHFALLRLQLVELIRQCNASPGRDINPALEFATTQLGPRAPTNPQFLEDLEKTMALVVFSHDSLDPSLAALLQPELRRQVADMVNKAILERDTNRRDAAIRHLVQMRTWSEETVKSEQRVDIPDHIDLGLNGEDQNGHENGQDTIMT